MVKLTHEFTRLGNLVPQETITQMSTIKDELQCLGPVAAAMVSQVRTLVKI